MVGIEDRVQQAGRELTHFAKRADVVRIAVSDDSEHCQATALLAQGDAGGTAPLEGAPLEKSEARTALADPSAVFTVSTEE